MNLKYNTRCWLNKGIPLSDDDSELAMLRRKKMADLIEREKKAQETMAQKQKVEVERAKLLKRFLAPDAESYLNSLSEREPTVSSRVKEIILYLIVYRGIRQVFSQVDIRYIERQVKGEEPTIRVQRDGETSDFGSYVREALRKNGTDE